MCNSVMFPELPKNNCKEANNNSIECRRTCIDFARPFGQRSPEEDHALIEEECRPTLYSTWPVLLQPLVKPSAMVKFVQIAGF